jgi:hypothetical protein
VPAVVKAPVRPRQHKIRERSANRLHQNAAILGRVAAPFRRRRFGFGEDGNAALFGYVAFKRVALPVGAGGVFLQVRPGELQLLGGSPMIRVSRMAPVRQPSMARVIYISCDSRVFLSAGLKHTKFRRISRIETICGNDDGRGLPGRPMEMKTRSYSVGAGSSSVAGVCGLAR